MDFSKGSESLLQALALLKDENDLSAKITNMLNAIGEDKSRSVSSLCEILALQHEDSRRKKRLVELLEDLLGWWRLLVNDREKLLLTITSLELEKDAIIKKQNDPKEIYGQILTFKTPQKKKPRQTTMITSIPAEASIASENVTQASIAKIPLEEIDESIKH